MEAFLHFMLKQYNISTNHIILTALVIIYGLFHLFFKYKMRNHPKIENSDGSKTYR